MPYPKDQPTLSIGQLLGSMKLYTQLDSYVIRGIELSTLSTYFGASVSSDATNEVYEHADIAARDAEVDPPQGSISVLADADGLGNDGLSFYDGSAWTSPVVFITPASGGGVSRYISNQADISSHGIGITYNLSGNVGTLTIPSDVALHGATIHHTTTEIAATDFVLRILVRDCDWGKPIAAQGNVERPVFPQADFWQRDNNDTNPPTDALPYTDGDTAPPTPRRDVIHYENYDDGGVDVYRIDIKFRNVDDYDNWSIVVGNI